LNKQHANDSNGFYFCYLLELASHPDVLEVTVVARDHVKWGERPMAFVVLHPRLVSSWKGRHNDFAKELKAHAKERLPGFACPEWVEIVQELPVSFVFYCDEYIYLNLN
jgi:acyl-CoA synthetase (AMP-forming)/AMP-acid ligase II